MSDKNKIDISSDKKKLDILTYQKKKTLPPPQDFEGRLKVREWLDRMETMAAEETLSESDVRQLLFVLDTSYVAFTRLLQHT